MSCYSLMLVIKAQLSSIQRAGHQPRKQNYSHFLGLALAVRLLMSSHFLLSQDETNYWQWSRYLDIGYYDHPPMIAWTIWLAGRLFGQTEFAVRLPPLFFTAWKSDGW